MTRVVSEPVLSDLSTRSYFWRRSYLFQDLGGASSVGLGPSSPSTVGIRLTPHGGNSLLLTFSRDARRLLSARSTGFAISFASPTRFRDESLPGRAFDAEIRWMGLPTGSMEDATAGGWLARWTAATAETPLGRSGHGVKVEARLSGVPVKLAIDASCDGPMRARSSLADRLSLAYREDVLGRPVARGAALEIGSVSFPSVSVERSERVPGGADAAAGAVLFREAIIELDPAASRLRLHDPARWAPPEGFYRAVLDDDGDRPVAILARGPRTLRLLVPTASDTPLVLETTAAARLELSGSAQLLSGLRWGAAHLPPVAASTADLAAERERGEDGLLGFDLLLRGRVFLDLPHRWAYIAPPQP